MQLLETSCWYLSNTLLLFPTRFILNHLHLNIYSWNLDNESYEIIKISSIFLKCGTTHYYIFERHFIIVCRLLLPTTLLLCEKWHILNLHCDRHCVLLSSREEINSSFVLSIFIYNALDQQWKSCPQNKPTNALGNKKR